MAQFQGPPMYRPFMPGERRQNADGSYSTEITTTWQQPNGQWVNAPSLWMGPNGPTQFNENDEEGIMGALRNYEQSRGPYVKRFGSVDDAVAAAEAKSKGGGVEAGKTVTLNIGGKRVKVSDDFLSLSPEQQNATVDEIVQSMGGGAPMADQPFEATSPAAKEFAQFASQATQNPAAARYEMLPAWQKPLVAGNDILSTVANGATFGFGDKAVAGARSLFTGKSYQDELADARAKTQGARNRSGWAGTVGELAGGVRTAASLAGRGLTLTGMAGRAAPGLPRLGALSGTMAAEGGAYGAASALGNDTDLATGVATGAVIGGLTPGAFAVLRNTFAPIFARLRPEQATNSAIETMVARSGKTPQQIVDDLNAAAREGQDVFTVADALGNPGQRMLSTVARTPGDARGLVVDALESRQAGQGNRISSALAGAFDAGDTAAQRSAALTSARNSEANANYGAARENAGPVDVRSAIGAIDERVPPTVTPEGIGDNSVYAAIKRMRGLLTPNKGGLQDVAIPPSGPAGISYDDAIAKLKRNGVRQEGRVLNQLAPSGGRRPAAPQSLSEFVASQGGILDFKGEAAKIAGGIKTRYGKVVRDDGKKTLDYMREAAEEAGYLHDYTTDEFGRASVDDFLRALDDDIRGSKIFARQNLSEEGALEAWEKAMAARDSMRGSLDQIGQELSGTVSDDVVARAAQLMETERMAADEALQKAISDDLFENGMAPQSVSPGMFPDPQNPGARSPSEPVLDFDRALLAKIEMDDLIGKGGATAGLLKDARKRLDDAIAAASAPYSSARDAYRQASKNIEAVETGTAAASGRARASNTIPAFGKLGQSEQSAFRVGYADPLIARTEASAFGVNKARPLLNDKMAREFPAFAIPGRGGQLGRQLGREQTMFETRNHALGGSRTADNLADQAEMSLFDPSILGNLLSGNWGAAAASAGRQSIANIQGLSPTVRAKLADFLLTRNSSAAMKRIAASIKQGQKITQRDIATIRLLVGSGVMGTSAAQRRGQ